MYLYIYIMHPWNLSNPYFGLSIKQVTHLSSDTACTCYIPVSHSLTLRLSVLLQHSLSWLSVWQSICSLSQSCLYFTVDELFCLWIWVMSLRCSVPGQRVKVSPSHLFALSSVIGHFLVRVVLRMHTQVHAGWHAIRACNKHRYAPVHIMQHGERTLRCRSNSCVWSVKPLWSNCEVF